MGNSGDDQGDNRAPERDPDRLDVTFCQAPGDIDPPTGEEVISLADFVEYVQRRRKRK